MTPGQACADCGIPMVPQKNRAPKGMGVHVCHGRCRRCASRHRKTWLMQVPSAGSGRQMRGDSALQRSVDEIAVERAVRGDHPARLTMAETALAVAELSRLGLRQGEIARRLGVCQRTVCRHVARARADAGNLTGVSGSVGGMTGEAP